MNPTSFFFYDYETFGRDPRKDKIAQFAGIRTDIDLNPIGDPITLFCKPSKDFLPDPEACLITGITPQIADAQGIKEFQFMGQIKNLLGAKGTCHIGYNNIKFDDEFTRFGFYKNFINPYSHEWADNNSRLDALDILRFTYALRPEGIVWPENDEGKKSFKLEHLSVANKILHENAHDATADVLATVEVLRLVKTHQPKLFNYAMKMRNKAKVKNMINNAMSNQQCLLTVSPFVPVENGHLAFMYPICYDTKNSNAVIAYDLRTNPELLKDISIEELKALIFKKKEDMKEGDVRPGLQQLYINRSSIFAETRTLSKARALELNISLDTIEENRKKMTSILNDTSVMEKVKEVFNSQYDIDPDVDTQLYNGFISNNDQNLANRIDNIASNAPQNLNANYFPFSDERLKEMLFRFKGRNFFEILDHQEKEEFKSFCRSKVMDVTNDSIGIKVYKEQIKSMIEEDTKDGRAKGILTSLLVYADRLESELQ
ncbi:exodeoxyribonuclease I [Flammeovirga sp. SubArs3]|uniref:exodeoxyribonuclease I n=1 Tax=Flammeovirga sp. SubArs3 TaxID=2995316 RepID=UPI00248B2292|nr:exodeoxyribonuclease I [Flammeovirga sp. SubArs3]